MQPDGDEALGWRGPLLAATMGTVLSLGLVELAARLRPLERIQKVDLTQPSAAVVDGVPIWSAAQSTARRLGADCGGRPEVLLVGSSIFWGSGVENAESLRPKLAALLPDHCVRSVAQPGYTFENQQVSVHRYLTTHTPVLVVWEVWVNMPNRWSILGHHAYNFGMLTVSDASLPSPLGLPQGLHQTLFSRSAAYEHLVIGLLKPQKSSWNAGVSTFIDEAFAPEIQHLQEQGITVVLAYMPALSRPFSETAADPPFLYARLQQRAESLAPGVDIATSFAEEQLELSDARVDTCCHLSPSGNARAAVAIADAIRPLLALRDETPTQPADAMVP